MAKNTTSRNRMVTTPAALQRHLFCLKVFGFSRHVIIEADP